MEERNVFINKKEIDELFEEEKYKNCMDKKYFEYIVSTGNIEYIDKYLKHSKNKKIIESIIFTNKTVKIIDRLSVKYENKKYVGELESSGIYNIEIYEEIVKRYHNQILTDGVFCLIKLEENIDEEYPYYIQEIEVLEDIDVNLDEYRKRFSERVKKYRIREKFDVYLDIKSDYDEISEMDLVLNTIGISTKELTFWEKILFLVRLIPLCEANYNLMELGGNGIGKTKTYSMFSPECEIVQEMLTTELIYNKQSNEKGLLATKDVIVFDEVNKIKIDSNNEKIIPQLLNFMADGQTTSPRKVISKTSLVFSGNVMGIEERIEKNEKNIFDNSHKFEDNAFLDRIHFFLPAWGLRRYSRNIHGLNTQKRVFRFDYFSKALSCLREEDYSKILDEKGYRIDNCSEREARAIRKTVSGLIKLTHPDKEIDDITIEAYIAIAIKGRGLINKFLHNKNKNNVNEINVKIIKTILMSNGSYKEYEIPVNELLKRMIYVDNFTEISSFYNEKRIQINNYGYFNCYNNYFYSDYIKKIEFNPDQNSNFKNYRLYEGKYYPNRHIISMTSPNGLHIVYIKIALDKLGIERNKREYARIKAENSQINVGYRGNTKRVLIIEAINQKVPSPEGLNNGNEFKVEVLINTDELNYDGLFGGEALDKNKFSDSIMENAYKLELDFSNFFLMDSDKKIKCENCKQEIKPIYMCNRDNRNYYYKCSNKHSTNALFVSGEYQSKPMNYVEFKYFLRENGVIKF